MTLLLLKINLIRSNKFTLDYWYKFVGLDGKIIGMTTFGESAPAKDLFQHFGITTEAVVDAVKSLI